MIPSPELGDGDETARVHHASWWCGGVAARDAGLGQDWEESMKVTARILAAFVALT